MFFMVYVCYFDEVFFDVLVDIFGGGKILLFYKNLVKEGLVV